MRMGLWLLVMLAFSGPGMSGDPVPTYRVLVVGDSWADFMWADRALRERFAAEGRPDVLEKGDVTAISGSTAAEWATPSFLQLITDELLAFPEIHLVQLTLGGNDFLAGEPGGGWYVSITPEAEALLLERVAGFMATVIQHIQALDPDISIVLSLYDYPNFEDSLVGPLAFLCDGTWQDMGSPTTQELNEALTRFLDRAELLASNMEAVQMVRHLGLMQSHFGFPGQGIPPGQIQPPGDTSLPSPAQAMRFGGFDCIHVNSEGNDVVAANLWTGYYTDMLCQTDAMILARYPEWPESDTVADLLALLTRRCR